MGRILDLLLAAGAERSVHSRIGKWRLAVSTKLDSGLPWPGSLACGPIVDGAVQDVLPAASLYPTEVVWYSDASKTVELLRVTYTRDGVQVTKIVWRVFNLSGALVLTVTDDITYSGLYEIERVRTVS